MTVKELIELNNRICDIRIVVRKEDGALIDELNIGPDYGIKPKYPTQVPIEEKYAGTLYYNKETRRDAYYIRKSINAVDNGKDYFKILLNKIPKEWLDLQITDWQNSHVYTPDHHNLFYYKESVEGISITALYPGHAIKTKVSA